MMIKCKHIPTILTDFSQIAPDNRRAKRGYVLIEILVAMTIFAIAGGVLIRSLVNAYEATGTLRDITKALYLTKVMLHDLELRYTRRADVQLGSFDGYYPYPGTARFHWYATIEYDRDKDAYVITVRTTWEDESQNPRRRRRGRWRSGDTGGITLKSMVLTCRYNEDLVLGFGGEPQVRKRGESGGTQSQRGGGRR